MKGRVCELCQADLTCTACDGEGCTMEEYMGGSSDGGPWGQMMAIGCSACNGRGWQATDSKDRNA